MIALVGSQDHWQLTGSAAQMSPTPHSLRVVVAHPILHGAALLRSARVFDWRISWIGDTGSNAGMTAPGNTGWAQADVGGGQKALAKELLYIDVDTRPCAFTDKKRYPAAPRYFTALGGAKAHWRAHGAHVLYWPRRTGFRVFVKHDAPLTPVRAERFRWTISWIGTDDRRSGTSVGVDWRATARGDIDGFHGALGLALTLDTAAAGFRRSGGTTGRAPVTYVASVSATQTQAFAGEWGVSGVGNIYAPRRGGFSVYVGGVHEPYFLKANQWRVNYIGYQGE